MVELEQIENLVTASTHKSEFKVLGGVRTC